MNQGMTHFTNVLMQRKLLNLWLLGGVLTSGTSETTSVTGRPKALPYWQRVTLKRLVDQYINVSITF